MIRYGITWKRLEKNFTLVFISLRSFNKMLDKLTCSILYHLDHHRTLQGTPRGVYVLLVLLAFCVRLL